MKLTALLIAPLLLAACAQDVLNTKPEVKIDAPKPDTEKPADPETDPDE